ncbi:MAG: helix-turn-helix domain-containing protein [Candidatus Methanomethylophilaceae archaeon]|nr:helix-turn-helix domain-containing protein [Candidatus Methanomethylophilaceae archaeon]
MSVNDLITGMLKEEGGFQKALKDILENDLNMTVNEFCRETGISQSTMYKILEEKREPNLRTVRMIVKAIKGLSDSEVDDYIAVIASHIVFENLEKRIEVNGRNIILKEYPVATVEDAIIAAVRAERDGALAIICAPIVAPTVEKIVSIPVSTVIPTNSIVRAIDRVKNDL